PDLTGAGEFRSLDNVGSQPADPDIEAMDTVVAEEAAELAISNLNPDSPPRRHPEVSGTQKAYQAEVAVAQCLQVEPDISLLANAVDERDLVHDAQDEVFVSGEDSPLDGVYD